MSLPLAVILRQNDVFICLLIKYLLFFGLKYMIHLVSKITVQKRQQ